VLSGSTLGNSLFLPLFIIGTFLLRLIYVWESTASPFFDAPIVDAHTFLKQALNIASGDLWGGNEPFWQPPLYIYLLALVCWLSPDDYFIVIRLVQIALGTFSCVLLYRIAGRCFDERTARIAGIAASICGTFIFFEGELLAVPLEVCLNLLLLRQLIVASDDPTYPSWITAGILAGLAALTRPNILLFIAIFVGWLILGNRDTRFNVRKRFVFSLFLLLPIFLTILPVTVRNYTFESDVVLISSNGGINFYIGNSGQYREKVSIHPGMQWEAMAMEPVRAGYTTAASKSAYFYARSFSYIMTQPLDYAQTLSYKLYLFLSGPEIKRNIDVYFAREYSHVLRVLLWDHVLSFPFGLIGPLFLVGLIATWHSNQRSIDILHLYVFAYTLSVLLFFVTARYRIPVLPLFILFAAVGAQTLYQHIRNRRKGLLLPTFLILSIALNWTATPSSAQDAQLQFDLGEVALRKGEYERSAMHSKRALALEPSYNYARHNLTVALLHLGKTEQAVIEGERTVSENPHRPDTHAILGRAYAKQGNIMRANSAFRRSLEIAPSSGMTHYYYGRFLYDNKRYTQAIHHLKEASLWQPNDPWIHYDLGRSLHRANNSAGAISSYENAWSIGRLPAAANAIGAVHLLAGRLDEAQRYFEYTLEVESNNIEALVNLSLLDVRRGLTQKGLRRLAELEHKFPNSETIRQAIRSVQPRR